MSMKWNEDIKQKVEKLADKYASSGQDLGSYLDGLLYANPLHYWDYTYVDTLLSLQHPKTDFITLDPNPFIVCGTFFSWCYVCT